MARNYVRKKLNHFEIRRVLSRSPQHGMVVMQQLREPYVIDGVPVGYFCIDRNHILLPKKRRGEEFVVHYTLMHEAIL